MKFEYVNEVCGVHEYVVYMSKLLWLAKAVLNCCKPLAWPNFMDRETVSPVAK